MPLVLKFILTCKHYRLDHVSYYSLIYCLPRSSLKSVNQLMMPFVISFHILRKEFEQFLKLIIEIFKRYNHTINFKKLKAEDIRAVSKLAISTLLTQTLSTLLTQTLHPSIYILGLELPTTYPYFTLHSQKTWRTQKICLF